MPAPRGNKLSKTHFKASLEPVWIGASMVSFDKNCWDGNKDLTANENGLPPNMNLPLQIQDIKIRLVHSESNASVVVGYQLLYQSLRTDAARDVWKVSATILTFLSPRRFWNVIRN